MPAVTNSASILSKLFIASLWFTIFYHWILIMSTWHAERRKTHYKCVAVLRPFHLSSAWTLSSILGKFSLNLCSTIHLKKQQNYERDFQPTTYYIQLGVVKKEYIPTHLPEEQVQRSGVKSDNRFQSQCHTMHDKFINNAWNAIMHI